MENNAMILQSMISGIQTQQITYTFTELQIPDIIQDQSLTLQDIIQKLKTPVNAEYFERIIRAAVGIGLLIQSTDEPINYRLTEVSQLLKEGCFFRMFLIGKDDFFQRSCWNALSQAVQTGKSGAEIIFGQPIFEFYNQNPHQMEQFAKFMTNFTSQLAQKQNMEQHSDLFANMQTITDLGGSEGILLCSILEINPHLQGAIFDLEHIQILADNYIKEKNLQERCKFQLGDFFKSETIPQSDGYILKWILHDWNDEQCAQILSNIHLKAHSKSKLIIIERILSKQQQISVYSDIHMMMCTGGKERTKQQFQNLLEQAKWRLDEVRFAEKEEPERDFQIIIASKIE